MLIGEYIHTVDEKNRVSLPARFRKEMGKSVVLAPGPDKSISMFTPAEWAKIADRLAPSSYLQTDSRSFSRFMFGGAVETDVDANGRILIPDFLKDRAGIKGKVAIIGVQNRAEMWNDKTWVAYKSAIDRESDRLAEKLGSVGMI